MNHKNIFFEADFLGLIHKALNFSISRYHHEKRQSINLLYMENCHEIVLSTSVHIEFKKKKNF